MFILINFTHKTIDLKLIGRKKEKYKLSISKGQNNYFFKTLLGFAPPEFKEPFYKESTEFTKNMVLNKEITYEQEEKYKEDKFGRLLGYVFVNGINLNVELVRNGLAKVVLYEKRAKIKYQDELLAAEKEAKEKNLGIWSSQ